MFENTLRQLGRGMVRHKTYAARAVAGAGLFEHVEAFYHRVRRDSTPGYVATEQYERETA